jgi:phosphoribosylformimino-5-aminoimidazole carboxamide ribotide isomerase
MNKWQTVTNMVLSFGMFTFDFFYSFSNKKKQLEIFQLLSNYCSEFLIHAAHVEGLCQGMDVDLIRNLSEWVELPCTYAGGAHSLSDLERVKCLSNGKIDLTMGSCLDIFGGSGVRFLDVVAWQQQQQSY